jgi:hypothetical protein
MPRAIPIPIRKRLFELADEQANTFDIAEALDIPIRTVRHLLAQRQRLEADGLQPGYCRCGRKVQPHQDAIDLRSEHPTWGAPYIRVVLAETTADPLPSTRTLQRHFAAAGLQPAPPGRRQPGERHRATAPHEGWQMDACERIALLDQEEGSWLRIADEYTSAFLGTRVFSPGFLATGAAATDPGVPA